MTHLHLFGWNDRRRLVISLRFLIGDLHLLHRGGLSAAAAADAESPEAGFDDELPLLVGRYLRARAQTTFSEGREG